MKQIVKGLVVVGAMVVAGSVNAAMMDEISPMVGADFEWSSMKGSGDWSKILPRSHVGGSVWAGAKFLQNFGAEVGYDFTTRQTKSKDLAVGDTFFGGTITRPVTAKGKASLQGWHVDVLGYLNVDECLDVFASLGWGWLKPNISSSLGGVDLGAEKSNLRGHVRLGLGGAWMFHENFGARAAVRWKNTSQLRLKDEPSANSANKPFVDAVSVVLGLFAKF